MGIYEKIHDGHRLQWRVAISHVQLCAGWKNLAVIRVRFILWRSPCQWRLKAALGHQCSTLQFYFHTWTLPIAFSPLVLFFKLHYFLWHCFVWLLAKTFASITPSCCFEIQIDAYIEFTDISDTVINSHLYFLHLKRCLFNVDCQHCSMSVSTYFLDH